MFYILLYLDDCKCFGDAFFVAELAVSGNYVRDLGVYARYQP